MGETAQKIKNISTDSQELLAKMRKHAEHFGAEISLSTDPRRGETFGDGRELLSHL